MKKTIQELIYLLHTKQIIVMNVDLDRYEVAEGYVVNIVQGEPVMSIEIEWTGKTTITYDDYDRETGEFYSIEFKPDDLVESYEVYKQIEI
jgi:hypothetical protein